MPCFVLENGETFPDPDLLKTVKGLTRLHDTKSLKRMLRLFSHYPQYAFKFSDKTQSAGEFKTTSIN